MRTALWAAALGAALVAAAMPASAQQAAGERERLAPGFEVDKGLLAAARQEGKVVFWCGYREPECQETVGRFEALTGIKGEVTRLSTGPLVTRLTQERNAGIHSVDVIHHADPGTWETLHKPKKWLLAYTPEGARKYAPQFRDKDGLYFAQYLFATVIAYNTKLVTGAEVPRGYADLTDAKYRGKLVMPHPKYSGGFTDIVIELTNRMGAGYLEKLKSNSPLVLSGSQYTLNPVIANGERALAVGAIESGFLEDKAAGKPVEIVYPAEGTILLAAYSGILADAPHPSAAKLFQEWLHSAPLQTILAQRLLLVPHPDAEYPAGRKKLVEINAVTVPIADSIARSAETKESFSDLFGG